MVEIAAYQSKRKRLYMYVLVRYLDVYKQPHSSKACVFHEFGKPLDEFRFCRQGNEIDTGQQLRGVWLVSYIAA
jgi:hypothetical protein